MLFLIKIIIIIAVIVFLAITVKVQIKIEKLEYSSQKTRYKTISGKMEKGYLKPNYQINLLIYILEYIPILKIKITKEKMKRINRMTHIKQKVEKKLNEENLIELKEKYNLKQDIKEILQNIKINIEELKIKIKIGTEDAVLTSFLVPIISTIIAIVITKNKIKRSNQHFQVIPIYQNKNLINLELKGIFEIKVLHIINTICILKKKRRVDKNERTSNRRTYDYSYE